MKLSPGEQVASYTVVALVGYGAMGHVYGARHNQLDRIVALKALPSDLAGDRTALARFRREALSASRLAHPNICTIHDFIDDPRGPFIVMEYLDGETLADRLLRQPLDEDTAANIALQLASGLAHAHGKGIVHRDLKPSNVMLTPDGVKILDFGVAKDMTRARVVAGDPAVVEDDATGAGIAVGTLPYMAPEQIVGGAVDARTDIYALGVIVHEMLTGRLPHPGPAAKDIVTGILTGEPQPFHDIPRFRQSRLARIAKRCMATDAAERYQSTAELAADLRKLGTTAVTLVQTRPWHRRYQTPISGLVVIGVIAATIYLALTRYTNPGEAQHTELSAPRGVSLSEPQLDAAISPDGRVVLFSGADTAGTTYLWLRDMSDRDNIKLLPQTRGAHTPFWSDDGATFGFMKDTLMWHGDTLGSPLTVLAKVSYESRGASWSRHGAIIYAPYPDSGIWILDGAGAAPRRLTTARKEIGETGHRWPYFLPDGNSFIYFVQSNIDSIRGIYLSSIDRPAPRKLVSSTSSALFADDHLLYYAGGVLWAQRFRRGRLAASRDTVATGISAYLGLTAASLSRTGKLVYSKAKLSQLVSISREGALTELTGSLALKNPVVSHDGSRVAVQTLNGSDSDILVINLQSARRDTFDFGAPATVPVWSPTGATLAYMTEEPRGYALNVWTPESRTPPQRVAEYPHRFDITDWDRDRRFLLNISTTGGTGYDIVSVGMADAGRLAPVIAGPETEISGTLSPSGHRIAYVAVQSGRFRVYVEDYPPNANRCRVSANVDAYQPQWGSDDNTLYYLEQSGRLMRVRVSTGSCAVSAPEEVRRLVVDNVRTASHSYAVNRADESIVVNMSERANYPPLVYIIDNWRATFR